MSKHPGCIFRFAYQNKSRIPIVCNNYGPPIIDCYGASISNCAIEYVKPGFYEAVRLDEEDEPLFKIVRSGFISQGFL